MSEPALRLAVLGSPIGHSRSPAIHLAAYWVLGLPWTYQAIDVNVDQLSGFLGQLDNSWRGLSLTMPLKREIMAHVNQCDELARTVGAVNTVLISDGQREGFNTDVYGARRMIDEAHPDGAARALILGAGATARSVVAALAQRGTRDTTVWVRSAERARELVQVAELLGVSAHVTTTLENIESPDVVISTLPGTIEFDPAFAAGLSSSVQLIDIAYDPWPTGVAQLWLDAGGAVNNSGLDMLIYQALAQIRIFVGGNPALELPSEPDVLAAMREAALRST